MILFSGVNQEPISVGLADVEGESYLLNPGRIKVIESEIFQGQGSFMKLCPLNLSCHTPNTQIASSCDLARCL